MASRTRCPACGSDTAGIGPCAACLLGDLFNDPPPPPRSDAPSGAPARKLGNYELIRRIGQGAGGIVHLARQTSLNRLVAVKLLHPGRTHSPEVVQRFRAEAVATARLQHPNIVAIHEIGEEDGTLFYSMDHVDGSTLAGLVQSGPVPAAKAAHLVHCLADAVEHAHAQGVLHRDLKPANVLVDRLGNPRIADFGLAKLLDGDSGLTSHGDILGSPSFMSPEQADGGSVGADASSDVYALGAILYYLLTGRPPYLGESVAATLKLVCEGRLVSPKSLNPAVPEQLERICFKALARERAHRFPTAAAMRESLGSFRFPEPHPTLDRRVRPGILPRGWSPARLLVRVAAGATLALLIFTGVLASLRQREQSERTQSHSRYAETIRVAHRELTEGHPASARRVLEDWKQASGNGEAPGFEWHHLLHETRPFDHRILLQRNTPIDTLAFDPNRGQLAFVTGPYLGWMDLWSLEQADLTLAEPIAGSRLAFSPDSAWLAVGGPHGTRFEATLYARKSSLPSARALRLAGLPASSLATWSPDGALLVLSHPESTAEPHRGTISAWDVATGKQLPRQHHSDAQCFGWSPDDQTLLVLDMWQDLLRWNIRSNDLPQSIRAGNPPVAAVFSPDGKYLATVSDVGRLRLTETRTGKVLAEADGIFRGPSELAFSPDGLRLASADGLNYRVLLWDVPTLSPRGECTGHTDLVTGITFTARADSLLTSSRDGSIRLWNLGRAAAYPLVSSHLPAHNNGEILFSPDGLRVAITTLHADAQLECRVLRLADYSDPGPVFPFLPIAWSPDSRQLLGCPQSGRLALWDVTTHRQLAAFPSLTTASVRTRLSPDGRWLASVSDEGMLHLVHIPTGQSRKWPTPSVQSWAFSPDSAWLAISGPEGPLLWEFETGRQRTLPGIIGGAIAMSADGKTIAVEGERGTIRVLDFASGKRRLDLARHEGRLTALGFSPDGRSLASGGEDRQLRFWLLATGESLASFPRIEPPISTTFSPDGRWLIVGSRHAHEILAAPGVQIDRPKPAPGPESFWTQPLEIAARFRTTERFSRGHNINPWE